MLVEDLNPVVACVGDEELPIAVADDVVGVGELPVPIALLSPLAEVLSGPVELLDPVVPQIYHEERAVSSYRDSSRPVELTWPRPGLTPHTDQVAVEIELLNPVPRKVRDADRSPRCGCHLSRLLELPRLLAQFSELELEEERLGERQIGGEGDRDESQ